MILHALCGYYTRKNELPRFGFEERAISFVVVLDGDGKFVQIEDTRERAGRQLIARRFTVPSLPSPRKASLDVVKSGATAGMAWDHFGYVFGQPKIDKNTKTILPKDQELADAQLSGFKEKLKLLSGNIPEDKGVSALLKFYQAEKNLINVKESELWIEITKKDRTYIAFRLVNESHLICQSSLIIDYVQDTNIGAADGLCLVKGIDDEITRTHNSVNVSRGTNPKLVSFNKESFESYGKSQSYNSPIGRRAGFEYSTALNHLLRATSNTKFNIADTQYVCWADKPNRLETDTPLFFSMGDDDPDGTATAVKALFGSIHNGAYQKRDGIDRFFVLGLAPNKARIVVRYWKAGTIAQFAENLAAWFSDLELSGSDHFGYPTLKSIVRATALKYKEDQISPKLPGDVIAAILSGGRIPETLVLSSLNRIKAERNPKDPRGKSEFNFFQYIRVCAIKAYLNRKYRYSSTKQKELTVSLDLKETRTGYCLGRLFAVLEKLQQDAQPGINATIRDRYYSSASTTPKAVFGTLMRLSTHHIKKLENPGWRVNAEKRISGVMDLIKDFPSHLNLEHQGLFALGYYHQKQDFYTRKPDEGEDA